MKVSKLPWLHLFHRTTILVLDGTILNSVVAEKLALGTEKRISRMKRTFFIDNVKNMFVLSMLQTVGGTSTAIKSYCTF